MEPQKRILIPGVFDLFTVKEMRVLQTLKSNPANFIILGVYGDQEIKENDLVSIMTSLERSENLKHAKNVDEIIFPCPFIITKEFVESHSIDAVGSEVFSDNFLSVSDIFFTLPNEGGVSSKDIIFRVLNEFDEYAERTLERKYGYQELGLTEIEAKCLLLRLGRRKNKIS